MFCALREAICGKNCFKVGVRWIRLPNVLNLYNIVVVGEEKTEGNEFLKIHRGPVLIVM